MKALITLLRTTHEGGPWPSQFQAKFKKHIGIPWLTGHTPTTTKCDNYWRKL